MANTNNNHEEFSIQIVRPGEKGEMLVIHHARLMFTNFAGQKTQFNREGDRNFAVVLDDIAAAEELKDHGWNIKIREPRTPDEDPLCTLKVNVRFDGRTPPKVWMVKDNKMTLLTDVNVGELDMSRIIFANIAIRPYHYEQGGGGISAYLTDIRCHVEPGIFDDEYAGYTVDTSSLNISSDEPKFEEDGHLPF